ncbi:MAG: VOC family protein [Gammaproteobacteria bacterium]|nr:VOC family protein [Gammaproteobacteria bacterium]
MSSVSLYLNFQGQTEAAFGFYARVFGTAPVAMTRFEDLPPDPSAPPMPEAIAKQILNVQLPILGGFMLMGSDVPEGRQTTMGNNCLINLSPDTRMQTRQLFSALSAGGVVNMPLEEMFWGGYFGSLTDQFGIHWMFNCHAKESEQQ